MKFLTSKTFLVTTLLQAAGPFLFSFGDWSNVIQYVSGFGMAYGLWHYLKQHKVKSEQLKEITALVRRVTHQNDSLHEQVKEIKQQRA